MARKPARADGDLAQLRPESPRRARVEVQFEEPTLLGAVFGQFDANLVQIENRLGVYIAARGNRDRMVIATKVRGRKDAGRVRVCGGWNGIKINSS